MTLLPNRNILDGTKSPATTTSEAKTAFGQIRDFLAELAGVDSSIPLTNRNRIINGNFAINQRAKSGTVTLAAGAYGHDRWKAGAAGCTYTFATSGIDAVITITAGSLMQVIEDKNVEGGVYCLSHAGTAQARIAINGAATSGSYANATLATPLLAASATANQSVTVEFATGTVSRAQLEPGTTDTPFERRPYGVEIGLCQQYYQNFLVSGRFPASAAAQTLSVPVTWQSSMRAAPTAGTATGGTNNLVTSIGLVATASTAGRFEVTSSGAGDCYALNWIYPLIAEL
jgi:hypothetical protein